MSTTDTNTTSFDNDSSVVIAPAATSTVNSNDIETRYQATEAQLSSQQSDAGNCAYNEISSLSFVGQLDADTLRAAIDKVVQRHGSLRSTLSADGQEVLVHKSLACDFEFVDFSETAADEIEESLVAVVQRQSRMPFHLINGPLVRVVLQKIAPEEHLSLIHI